ncbi:hypothetical protein J6590_024935 [Homalodisca vitripennis]|nr:hypothetical protein J6590_024935 [Homalodisca vitripennis]
MGHYGAGSSRCEKGVLIAFCILVVGPSFVILGSSASSPCIKSKVQIQVSRTSFVRKTFMFAATLVGVTRQQTSVGCLSLPRAETCQGQLVQSWWAEARVQGRKPDTSVASPTTTTTRFVF